MQLSAQELGLGFGIGLAVGALVGIERERKMALDQRSSFGGIRTFPLIGLAGGLFGLLLPALGQWGLAIPLLALTALLITSFLLEPRTPERPRLGLTSEIAALCVFGIGALPFIEVAQLAFQDRLVLAGALGAVVMAVLSLREPLHRLAGRISAEDLWATVRFALLAAVALPLLPNQTWDPYDALNPFRIGVVIVLIAGLSFVGYVAVRWLGARRGLTLTALFGGMVSSTAVTLTFSRRARETPALAVHCALAIVLACTIMFPRLLIEVLVLHSRPQALALRGLPALGAMFAVGLAGAALLYLRARPASDSDGASQPALTNPFGLSQALKLGAVFAAVRLVAAAAHHHFGSGGLYVSALLAGLTDVDAITVSLVRMNERGQVDDHTAVVGIVLAVIANTVVKGVLALALGGRRVGGAVALVLGLAAGAGIVTALLT